MTYTNAGGQAQQTQQTQGQRPQRGPVIPVASPATITLEYAEQTYHDPLVICISGPEGSGKSNLLGTANHLGLLATEYKSKHSVLKAAKDLGQRVIQPNIDLVRVSNPQLLAELPKSCIVIGDDRHKNSKPGEIQDEMKEIADGIKLDSPFPTCCRRHYSRWHVNRVKHCAYMLLADDRVKVIGIDTFGQFVQDVLYAHYGLTGVIDPKEFGFAPREDMVTEVREFLNAMTRKHLILTHHQKDVWADGKPVKGKRKPDSAFSQIGHYMTLQIEQYRRGQVGWVAAVGDDAAQYQVVVKDCTANPSLIRPEPLYYDEDISFGNLAMAVYPDAKDGEFD